MILAMTQTTPSSGQPVPAAGHGLRGELKRNAPLARYTSWRVGGTADYLYRPADLADLCAFLHSLDDTAALFWLGLGSNTLIRDGGIRGYVIATQGCLDQLTLTGTNSLRAEAGVACAKVARFAARNNLSGAEFLAGIPGTMGGALAMNAGAWGGETWQRITQVETVDRQGRVHHRRADAFAIAYRSVKNLAKQKQGDEWFVAAHLDLPAGDGADSLALIKRLLEQRGQTQPTGVASCGSVFRNPPGDYAARLIESAGLKGFGVGKARVSQKHANFIINEGGATAADLESLIEQVAAKVAAVHAVELIREVHIVGEHLAKGGHGSESS